MRVIITGGTGFIGRALTRKLLARGCEVVILSRGKQRKAEPGQPEIASWDGKSARGWGRLADGAYGIVNLAGENIADGRWNARKKQGILQSRILAGQAVCQAVSQAENPPKVLLQASASGYYGLKCQGLCREDAPNGQGFLAQIARKWEESTLETENFGVRRAVARTSVVLNASGGALPRMLTPFKFFAGGPLGSGRQGFPWITLEDEVEAIEFLLFHPEAKGAFNLCAPQAVTQAEFCRVLGQVLGRPSWLAAPRFVLRLAMGEMADEVLLGGCGMEPARLLDLGYKFRYPALLEALRHILGKD